MLVLSEYNNSNLHKNNLVVAVFLYVSSAFHVVSYSIFVEEMHFYGITDNSLDFFCSFLSGRKQKVLIGHINLSKILLTAGNHRARS